MSAPVVAVLAASKTDLDVMEKATKQLEELGVAHEVVVVSPQRNPTELAEWARGARDRGLRVVIAGDTGAAQLAGVVAAHTTLPVIGVPCRSAHLGGADALYGTVQMPEGFPVATVGLDAARNAAILAAQVVALVDPAVADALADLRARLGEDGLDTRAWGGGSAATGFGFRP